MLNYLSEKLISLFFSFHSLKTPSTQTQCFDHWNYWFFIISRRHSIQFKTDLISAITSIFLKLFKMNSVRHFRFDFFLFFFSNYRVFGSSIFVAQFNVRLIRVILSIHLSQKILTNHTRIRMCFKLHIFLWNLQLIEHNLY